MDNKQRRSVDGIAPRGGVPNPRSFRPHHPSPAPAPKLPAPPAAAPKPAAPPRRLDFTAPPRPAPRWRWWRSLLFPLSVLACLSASIVVQSLPLGMGVIAIYAAVVWLRRLPARYSFVMAFLALVTVPVLLVRQNIELAGNFATYTFLLLVVGIVSQILEGRNRSPRRRSKILHLHR